MKVLLLILFPALALAKNVVVSKSDAWSNWHGSSSRNKEEIKTHYQCGNYTVYDTMESLVINRIEHSIARIDSDEDVMYFTTEDGKVLRTSVKGAMFKADKHYIQCEIIAD
ncbi:MULTISPECIES: hypothetical protein [unclassified Cedecea]|uniref:hypothetical protein n=1 Tax=unclassified Cedecea TaxID=2649846 RepID=UPI003018D582